MTNAELAILSLIVEQARHGYEIEQVIEARGMRDWTEVGFSSIYYLLKKLEKKGFIEAHLEQSAGSGPARNVYQATSVGYEAWLQATLAALSMPQTHYTSFLLGLANLPAISPDEVQQALQSYQKNLEIQLKYAQSRQEKQQPLPYFVNGMFDYSLTLLKAELDWVKEFIQQISKEESYD